MGFLGRRARDDFTVVSFATQRRSMTSNDLHYRKQSVEESSLSAERNPLNVVSSFSSARRGSTASSISTLTTDRREEDRRAVGTPDYLSPESILGIGQDAGIDWWAVGVICYEFIYGFPPFHADTPSEVFENILSRNFIFDDEIAEIAADTKSFIDSLLCMDVKTRLGSSRDSEEIKEHPFFTTVNWQSLSTDQPKFIPKVKAADDTSYFDSRGMEERMLYDIIAKEEFEEELSSHGDTPEETPSDLGTPTQSPLVRCVSNSSLRRASVQSGADSPILDDQLHQLRPEFGSFSFKNLPLLQKANEDAIRKLRLESGNPSYCGDRLASRSRRVSVSSPMTRRPRNLSFSIPDDRRPRAVSTLASPSSPLTPNSEILSPDTVAPILAPSIAGDLVITAVDQQPFRSFKHQLLIADSNLPRHDKVKTALLNTGYSADIGLSLATDGTDAITIALGDCKFDLIFIAVELPAVSGWTVGRTIRGTDGLNQNTPLVAILPDQENGQLLNDDCFNAFLPGNFTAEQLHSVLINYGVKI